MSDLVRPHSPSYWLATAPQHAYPALERDTTTEIAIVGGGLVGLTAAWLLKKAGLAVMVLEARRVGAQSSAQASAELTSLHGPGYAQLASRFDDTTAQLYGESLQAGVHTIAHLVRQLGIDCDFEQTAAYAYAQSGAGLPALQQALQAAQRLGLPASFVQSANMPFGAAGALRFDDQAQFHPVKYLQALAAAIPGDGSQVFEHTRVLDVDEGDGRCKVHTERAVVTARHVILATGLPFLDRGGYFSEAFPRTQVLAAARLEPDGAGAAAAMPDGIWMSLDEPRWSVRSARDAHGPLAICAGRTFKTAHLSTRAPRVELEAWVREHLRARAIEHIWTHEDYVSMDGLPFVGRFTRGSAHTWVATGLGECGMAGGTAAAMVLADLIRDKSNPWARIVDSTRIHAGAGFKRFVTENIDVAREWIHDHLTPAPEREPDEIAPGHAAIVAGPSGKVAAYRDDHGTLHTVSATCTHMGCNVAWNEVARSWDCPCHGSRFDVDGQVISGPAIKPLAAARVHTAPSAPQTWSDTYRAMVDPDAASFQTPDAASMNPIAARPRHAVPARDIARFPDTTHAPDAQQKGMPFKTPGIKTPDHAQAPTAAAGGPSVAAVASSTPPVPSTSPALPVSTGSASPVPTASTRPVVSAAAPAPATSAAVARVRPIGPRPATDAAPGADASPDLHANASMQEPLGAARSTRTTVLWTLGGVLLVAAAAAAWVATRPDRGRSIGRGWGSSGGWGGWSRQHARGKWGDWSRWDGRSGWSDWTGRLGASRLVSRRHPVGRRLDRLLHRVWPDK